MLFENKNGHYDIIIMSKNFQDPILKLWCDFFIDKKSNSSVSSSLKAPLYDLILQLKNSQNLYRKEKIFPKDNVDDYKSYLSSLFQLDKKISDEEYQVFFFLHDKFQLFQEVFQKILPFFIRGIIHYFYLLEKTCQRYKNENQLDKTIDLSIMDDKFTTTFFRLFLYSTALSDLWNAFDSFFIMNYPTCYTIDPKESFILKNDANLKFRSFDSSVFREIILCTANISEFQLTVNYFLLLLSNIDKLNTNEFLNINTFCNTMIQKYINTFFKVSYPSSQNEIIDDFFKLIHNLYIGKKEEKRIIFSSNEDENNENDNNGNLDLFDSKVQSISLISTMISQIIQNFQNCRDHLMECNFLQYLIHYSIWSFENSGFLHILFKKNSNFSRDSLDLNQKNSQIVTLIDDSTQISKFEFSSKFTLKDLELAHFEKNAQYSVVPDEAKKAICVIKLFVNIPNNNNLISHLISEANELINSYANNDINTNFQNMQKQFNIVNTDDDLIDINLFISTLILVICETLRDISDKEQILLDFSQICFFINDFLFERNSKRNCNNQASYFNNDNIIKTDNNDNDNNTNNNLHINDNSKIDSVNNEEDINFNSNIIKNATEDKNNNDNSNNKNDIIDYASFELISSNANSNFLKFVRNSLYATLLNLPQSFLPQIIDVFSGLIVGSKISICDEIIIFLIQLMNAKKDDFFSNFHTNLFILPLISYGSLLHGNTSEMKRFYYFLYNLLSDSRIINEFFEKKFFVIFIFNKFYDNELSEYLVNFLSPMNLLTSKKAVKNLTNHFLINSIQSLTKIEGDIENLKEHSKSDIEIIEKSFLHINLIFYNYFYFHKKSSIIACKKTKLIDEIDKCLSVIQTNENFYSILQLIYSLQYYSNNNQIIKEFFNDQIDFKSIYQKDFIVFSKLELNSTLKKMLGTFSFGFQHKNIFEMIESAPTKVIPIKNIESLWMIHNILKYNIELHDNFFNYIEKVIDDLFYNQIQLSNSQFLQNCLNYICKSESSINDILLKIVSHVLIWNFPSNLLSPKLSFNKGNFLNILKNCITKNSFNFPSNFAYLSVSNDNEEDEEDVNEKNKGILFGTFHQFTYQFTLTFSFRFESVVSDEYVIFNEIDNKFSIQISKEKSIQFFENNSIILNGDKTVNNFFLTEKEWHRIVISVTYSKVSVTVDGENAFSNDNKPIQLRSTFLSKNFSFIIGQKFDGLICDVQFLNATNYSESDLQKISKFEISNENRIHNSIGTFRPYINDFGQNLFYDPKYPQLLFFYEGRILLERNNLFKQLDENDIILCIFSNLDDSKILKKTLKILLKFDSIESFNFEDHVFPDDDSFLRFVFLLNDNIALFNNELFETCFKLFEKIQSIKKKQIFVSEFLFNLIAWKSHFADIYNRLIMNILPNLVKQTNSNSNVISSVSISSIFNAIENEESDLNKSFLFELLFSFLNKHLTLLNDQKRTQFESPKKIILNKLNGLFKNDSYCISDDALNLSFFNEEVINSDMEMDHLLIELTRFVEYGKDDLVSEFILRLFGLRATQTNTITVLEMMNVNCQKIIFKKFIDLFFSSSSLPFNIDTNSFYKLVSCVTEDIDKADILFGVLICLSSSQRLKLIDFKSSFEIYQLISELLIRDSNFDLKKVFFIFWSIILTFENDLNLDKICQILLKFESSEIVSYFALMLHLSHFKDWKSLIDKLMHSIISMLTNNLKKKKFSKMSEKLIEIFIDLTITISMVTNLNGVTDDNDANLLNLMDLSRCDESFKIFNSFGLDKIKNGLNSCSKEVLQFASAVEKYEGIHYNENLVLFIALAVCAANSGGDSSTETGLINALTAIIAKNGSAASEEYFRHIYRILRKLAAPQQLVSEMMNSFPQFSLIAAENQKTEKNPNSTENNTDTTENNSNSNTTENNSNSNTTENNSNSNTTENNSNSNTTENNSNSNTTENNSNSNTTENNSNSNKIENNSNANSNENNSNTISNENNSNARENDSVTNSYEKYTNTTESNSNTNNSSNADTTENDTNANKKPDSEPIDNEKLIAGNQAADYEDDLIKNLILKVLSDSLDAVCAASTFYIKRDFGRTSPDCDTGLRSLCNIEKSKCYLRSFQTHVQQTSDHEMSSGTHEFTVFSENYVPLLLTRKNPFTSVIEKDCKSDSKMRNNGRSSFVMEEVIFHFQGTKKKCHLFYDSARNSSFIVGGIEIQNSDVNFIVKHALNSIEFFLIDGFQFIIEFYLEKESIDMNPLFINSFNELSSSLINQKISNSSLSLIEIIILLNFLNGRSFNLIDNLPVVNDTLISQFILKNNEQNNINDAIIRNWAQNFFKLDQTINLNSISNNENTKIVGINRCIGILSSPISFFSICNKKVFCVDNDNTLRGASIILPPRVPKATIQIFNSNNLFDAIKKDIQSGNKHYQINSENNSFSSHCNAFYVININQVSNNCVNEFFVAASFNEFSGIFIYLIKMSKLLFIKSIKLNDNVKHITGTQNYFVFISKNSNKVHLIKIYSQNNSNSGESTSIDHSYFASHSSEVSIISVSKNFIVSIDIERNVCLTIISSLQTVATFTMDNIPKKVFLSNSPNCHIISLVNNYNENGKEEYKIISLDLNGKIIWEYKRDENNGKQEKITNMVLLNDVKNSNIIIGLIINNSIIECRRLTETKLLKNNEKIQIKNDDFEVILNSLSKDNISLIHYDEDLNLLGYIDVKNTLNGLFFEYKISSVKV